MTRQPLFVRIELENVHCHNEADGYGSAEPYLWAVFFMIDGSTVSVSDALTLTGTATTAFTPGSHGNLDDSDVDDNDEIAIPATIGVWQTKMLPIPFPLFSTDLGGEIGVIVALMEEDNVSDEGAEAGHRAMNDAIRNAINGIIATRTLSNQDITDEEIAGLATEVKGAVTGAIKAQQNLFENLWSYLNPDDMIGFRVFSFSHDKLVGEGTISFSERWGEDFVWQPGLIYNGDWELSGTISASPACPAEALQEILDRLLSTRTEPAELSELRAFRDGPYREISGLASWWNIFERNLPEIVMLLNGEPELVGPTMAVFDHLKRMPSDLDADIEDDVIATASDLARSLASSARGHRLRVDAHRVADLLSSSRSATIRELLQHLAINVPGRGRRQHEGGV